MFRLFPLLAALAVLLVIPNWGQTAGFGIDATRLIYPQKASSISVTLRNTMTTTPYLIQTGVGRTPGGAEPTPFMVTPPLFRLEPGRVNQVRITSRDTTALADDRESVFYFRASAIPASQAPEASMQASSIQGTVQFGVGNIIKLFYRPSSLPGTSATAQGGLQFSRSDEKLRVSNPSPYFVNLASLAVGNKMLDLATPSTQMIAPFSTQTYTAPGLRGTVTWKTISDEGGINAFTHNLP